MPEHHPRMLKVTMELAFVYQVHGRKDAALALYDRGTKHWASMLGAVRVVPFYGPLVAHAMRARAQRVARTIRDTALCAHHAHLTRTRNTLTHRTNLPQRHF